MLIFDAYGTLFDFGSAVSRHASQLGDDTDALNTLWRQKQIEYTQLRTLMRRYTDFETVTREALRYALQALGHTSTSLEDALMKAYSDLTPFDDAITILEKLDEAGFGAAILSNGSPTMLNSTVEAAGLQDAFEYVLSVEQVGVFKPDPATYRLAVEAYDLEPRRMLFVSANAWDVAGASTFGFQTAWINRAKALPENVPGKADVELKSLTELADLLTKPQSA